MRVASKPTVFSGSKKTHLRSTVPAGGEKVVVPPPVSSSATGFKLPGRNLPQSMRARIKRKFEQDQKPRAPKAAEESFGAAAAETRRGGMNGQPSIGEVLELPASKLDGNQAGERRRDHARELAALQAKSRQSTRANKQVDTRRMGNIWQPRRHNA